MWRHPITAKQIRVLAEDWGVKEELVPVPEGEVGSSQGGGWFQVISVCCCPLSSVVSGKC